MIEYFNEDCLEGMKLLDDNSIDNIVTDPPYEVGVVLDMTKDWTNGNQGSLFQKRKKYEY